MDTPDAELVRLQEAADFAFIDFIAADRHANQMDRLAAVAREVAERARDRHLAALVAKTRAEFPVELAAPAPGEGG